MTQQKSVTGEVVDFIQDARLAAFPAEAVAIAKRCIIDGLGVMLAGSTQEVGHILRAHVADSDVRSQATVFGTTPLRSGASSAALVNGTSGHALDWDDTQLATSADRIFGLLTHPTVPPMVAALAVGEPRHASGSQVLEAFLTGFEVECKIAEAIHPNHYKKGFHSSGTIGTFGAMVASAKLLGLGRDAVAHALAITSSMASGIRVNFGTMTKPLHVGRAAQNGVMAAELAQRGLTGGARRPGAAVGLLPGVQPRRRLRRRSHRRQAGQPAHHRLAGRLDQALPVRRAGTPDDGRHAPAGRWRTTWRPNRSRASASAPARTSSTRCATPSPTTSSRRSSARRSWSRPSRCGARPASTSSTTRSCRARRCRR